MARVTETLISDRSSLDAAGDLKSDHVFGDDPDRVDLTRINRFLAKSAPLALAKSQSLCTSPEGDEKSTGGENCAWLHGSHQYLLLLGLAATPVRNLAFYRQEIQRAACESGARRILIAGCCDYMMLAIVLDAYGALGIVPDITVVDRCNTPLYLCRWYADLQGHAVTTLQSSFLTYEPDEPFDLVSTDGLISNFWPELRADLVSAWHKVLKPGGFVVTTNNIQPGKWGGKTRNNPETVEAICRKAVRLHAALPVQFDLPDPALCALTRDYVAHPTAPAVRSVEEFTAVFRPDLFAIDLLDVSEIDGLTFKDSDETGHIRKTLNARIIAQRL